MTKTPTIRKGKVTIEPEEKDRRLWAKIDVDYFDNLKIDELSDTAPLLLLTPTENWAKNAN